MLFEGGGREAVYRVATAVTRFRLPHGRRHLDIDPEDVIANLGHRPDRPGREPFSKDAGGSAQEEAHDEEHPQGCRQAERGENGPPSGLRGTVGTGASQHVWLCPLCQAPLF